MKNILTVFKKELKRFLGDRRMLATLLMPGILLYIVYSLMGNFMGDMIKGGGTENQSYTVYVDNRPVEFESFESSFESAQEGATVTVNPKSGLTHEQKLELVKNEEAAVYIVYEQNFYQKFTEYTPNGVDAPPQVEIYYNSISTQSQVMYSYYMSILDSLEESRANILDINAGNKSYDLATESDMTTYIFSMVLPMLLNVLLLTGCMATASESVAGEKERGTVATLLVTPVKRSHLALGKVFALAVVSLISATSSFLGLIFSLPKLMGVEFSAIPYGFVDYLAILAIIIVNVLLFTVIMTLISTFAKSVKEAQGFASPIMILVMVLSLASSFMPSLGLTGYLIPILNGVMCLSGVVSFSFDLAGFFITLGVNAVVFGLGVFALSKMFSSEKIMFNK